MADEYSTPLPKENSFYQEVHKERIENLSKHKNTVNNDIFQNIMSNENIKQYIVILVSYLFLKSDFITKKVQEMFPNSNNTTLLQGLVLVLIFMVFKYISQKVQLKI